MVAKLGMSKKIEVGLLQFVEHETLREALRVPGARARHAELVNQHVVGQVVEDFAYDGRSLSLLLSSRQILTFDIEGAAVTANVRCATSWQPQSPDVEPDLRLQHAGGACEIWRWQDLLGRTVGREIRSIGAGEAWLWLYLRDLPGLMFSPLRIKDTGDRLLHFGPE